MPEFSRIIMSHSVLLSSTGMASCLKLSAVVGTEYALGSISFVHCSQGQFHFHPANSPQQPKDRGRPKANGNRSAIHVCRFEAQTCSHHVV
ncbi:hypothetical protein BJX68DRAFT_231783 [Aspergillus pseudodeflectus]|uniref:Secreted protein n=1 Tax=Aspergillus pseudodeflectus TaxID=176178 RepID=A0ABR4KVG2_9EURO